MKPPRSSSGGSIRKIRILTATLGLALSVGCVSSAARVVLDRVGPAAGYFRHSPTPAGYLQVFSATERINDGNIEYDRHTAYSIYTEAGKHLKGVPNRVGPDDSRPTIVDLRPGAYRIHARAEGFGQVEVPVRIARARLTAVHLERGGMPPSAGLSALEAVRLPDGRIIGPRALDAE